MNILIVALVECCPAVIALRSERLDFELVIVEDEYTYGKALKECWQRKEQFINLEHDIVPWPGALRTMWNCREDWCGYDYIAGYSGVFSASLGCVRFSEQLVRMTPAAHEGWEDTIWQSMDAAVFSSIPLPRENPKWHVHKPPVAHLTPLKQPNIIEC